MRQTSKTRRTIGIRGQLMGFLCFICLLLVGLFWFLSTQLLEPLYTTHIQKQLTEQAEAIVARMDEAIGKGETLSYWAFGSRLYVNNTFFNALRDDIFELGGMSSFCIDISDTTLRQIFKVDNLSYCNLHRTRPTDTADEQTAYTTARAMRQLCRESGGTVVRKINPPTPSGSVQLMVGRMTSDGNYTVLVTTSLMHVAEAGKVLSTVLPLAAALIFAFSMSAAWLFSEWFTKPLRALSGAARQVAQGNYAVHVDLELKAYGKINLGLDVVRRREDGYHEVRMIMQTVRVYDAIELNRTEEEGIRLSTNLYYLPDNENNLGYRAAKLLMDEFGIRDGVEIKMKKFIPVAAGMAGGSSDAAAVLFGVNKMFGLGLSKQELMERGVRLGADVPYCIMRGTALSEGIGEILTPLPPMPQCRVLIAKPAISVSTKHVYESLNLPSLGAEAHPDIDAMRAAIEKKDLSGVVSQLGNVLETVTIPENPVIQTLKDKMMEMGADGSLMSGSGPTVFGLFTNQTAAQAAYEELRYGSSQDLAKQVYLTSFYNRKGHADGEQF